MAEQDYGADYFLSHCGIPYNRDEPHWLRFFGNVAQRIDETLSPKTVFDAGCAIGFLVEALRARGIEAFGRDFSTYAISQVPAGLKPYCECASITDPIEGSYDLVTCIEVLEHMPPEDARLAVKNLCSVAPQVLFSSSPVDFEEETHINVQPPLYWMQLFAEEGFAPRAGYDGSFLCPWAILFERRERAPDPNELEAQSRLVLARIEIAERNAAAAAAKARAAAAEAQPGTGLPANGHDLPHDVDLFSAEIEVQESVPIEATPDVLAQAVARLDRAETVIGDLRGQVVLLQAENAKMHAALEERQTQTVQGLQSQAQELSQSKRELSEERADIVELDERVARLEKRGSLLLDWVTGRKAKRRRERAEGAAPNGDEALVAASGLFDADWYLARNPDAAAYSGGPIRHYLDYGAREGRDPNPFFSSRWYVASHPEAAASLLNPLVHYIRFGSEAGLRPSADFDPTWYRHTYPDATAAGVEPLFHYLHHGQAERRRRNQMDLSRDVEEALLQALKVPQRTDELVLFVTHAPAGRIKPHVTVYLDALRAAGLATVLIIVSEPEDQIDTAPLLDRVDGLFIRENGGFDFAAWAHVARELDLRATRLLCLANDSLLGPFSEKAMKALLSRVYAADAQLIGMTDNFEFKHHFQSYFLAAKDRGVEKLLDFLSEVRWLESKHEVIMAYEIQALDAFEAAGLKGEVLFPTRETTNRTIAEWRQLIREGFPFIKMAALQELSAEARERVLRANGFDPAIAEESIAIVESGRSGAAARSGSHESLAALSATLRQELQNAAAQSSATALYVAELERELVRARRRPWKLVKNKLKFKLYKWLSRVSRPFSRKAAAKFEFRARRRDPARAMSAGPDAVRAIAPVEGQKNEYAGKRGHDPAKPNVLLVSHQANRSGAPILVYSLAQDLCERYNVIILSLLGGGILDDFRSVSSEVIVANSGSSNAADFESLLTKICADRDFEFAIVNSIQSHPVLPVLRKIGVASIALIHEFAAYVGKKSAFAETMHSADETVFSTRLTLESALNYARDYTPYEHVIPQGKCHIPSDGLTEEERALDRSRLLNAMRPNCVQESRFNVLGVGTVELRKGVDLFLQVAAQMAARETLAKDVHFVWIGAGYDPEGDTGFSAFLQDQMQHMGIGDRLTILPPTSEIDLAYELADVLVVTSRLDPLPNVAIDALCARIPVLCFEGTTGIAEALKDAGLQDACVAGYLDTVDMTEKVSRLAESESLYQRVSDVAAEIGRTTYDFKHYVRQIEGLALKAKARIDNVAADAEEILTAGFFRADFFRPVMEPPGAPRQLVKDYIRRMAWGPRKPEPGFNPFIYALAEDSGYEGLNDPYADFLRKGRPTGPWMLPVLEGGKSLAKAVPASPLRSALHIHAYFTDGLGEIVDRISLNASLPDLFVSVGSTESIEKARALLEGYAGKVVAIEEVPNVGRDIGPFLTQFGHRLVEGYDMVGHVHIKKSEHVKSSAFVRAWSQFLLENILGGELGGNMLDQILHRAHEDERIGLIYPDDPHVIGWTRNMSHAEHIARSMGYDRLPKAINFPVGTMFWMRTAALRPFVDLGLQWKDYPREPLPEDGSKLHALERLFSVIPTQQGWGTLLTNIRGVTR
ncbi:rhamnan synthesis F family protein [Ancylobacter mangrovi]|uniref:rhamnan synthesis F family protein n=1 Tax=Ancylobacter mangrovi TaxID=2972472 RepID=UPI002163BC0E|nr:rhamnan synthesis F family protein [Ancylobacter mangrovi]MCS0505315.1 glycosyltransferase [Ancylobacter mangrovi]